MIITALSLCVFGGPLEDSSLFKRFSMMVFVLLLLLFGFGFGFGGFGVWPRLETAFCVCRIEEESVIV